MTRFIVRIELRYSKPADYEELHTKMAEKHFFKFAKFPGNDNFLRLPDAEYHFYSSEGLDNPISICFLARAIAEQVRANPKVVVVEIQDLFQLGLDEL